MTQKKNIRVADRAFPEIKVTWRQPGDFGRSLSLADRTSHRDVSLVTSKAPVRIPNRVSHSDRQ